MIKDQLKTHWKMCHNLRFPPSANTRQMSQRYFVAKKSHPLDDPLEQKAVNFVTEVSPPIRSNLR